MDHDDFKFRNEPGISAASFVAVLGSIAFAIFVAVQGSSSGQKASISQPSIDTAIDTASLETPFDPSPFILNALLVPAIDTDAVPLRWVDPRPASLCDPGTMVSVNGKPLIDGELVPAAPFTLDWQADDCQPLGLGGPRFNGAIRLRIFSEHGEYNALVEPSTLLVTFANGKSVPIRHGWATIELGPTTGEQVTRRQLTDD